MPPPPFKAKAQGNRPGDKLIFTEASPDNLDTHLSGGGMWGLNTYEEHVTESNLWGEQRCLQMRRGREPHMHLKISEGTTFRF